MATLSGNTILAHPETGIPTVLLAGEDVPDWAEELIGDHLIAKAAEMGTDADGDELPPKSGKGSGVEAWATYADAKGIAYPEGANRDEIIAAVEAHQAEQ
ncbi:MAG TPA: hypothetical protein VIQ11_12950 [Mycobacterium sp.]